MRIRIHVLCIFLFVTPYLSQSQNSFSPTSSLQPGKFLKNWLIAGPVMVSKDSARVPDQGEQENFFHANHFPAATFVAGQPLQVKGKDGAPLKWLPYTAPADVISLDSIFKNAEFAVAYAVTEVECDRNMPAVFAVGSDDAVKVSVNGKQVHKNWIARGVNADDDIISVELVKGKNTILLEVQNMQGGWAFTARFMDKPAISEKLIKASASGDMEQVKMLIGRGADPGFRGRQGVTALQAAKIAGRKQIEQLLIESGAKPTPAPSAGQLVDNVYADLIGKERPGIAVLVSQNGKVLYKKGFGYRDIKNKKPITTTTKFRIGSITKQFTASAILKLQEEGKLNVQDKISKYFPDFPRGNEVSIHHLLTHVSGIHSYTSTDSFLSKVTRPITSEALYRYIKSLPYDFNPGDRYEYNNSAYSLLSYLVEKISGVTFSQFLKTNFFDPIGMKNTGVYVNSQPPNEEALGYNKNGNKYDTALDWDMSWAAGAGALYSTVEDLDKWNNAFYAGKVLSEESMKAAFTPVVLNSGQKPPGTDYGYGWGINTFRGMQVIGHSGGLHGFISQLVRLPKENLTVAMLTNQTPVEVEINPNKIAEFFLWQKMDSQATYDAADVSDVNLKDYEGRYDLSSGMILKITSEDKSLFAQVSGQGRFEIFPLKKDEYFWKVVEAKIQFNRDQQGNVTEGFFQQGGFKVTAKKLKDEQYITVDSAVFRNYVGKYDFAPKEITITASNGKLFGQATGDPAFELMPLSAEEYHIPDLNARLLFVKGADGKASSIKITMMGMTREATRKK